MPYIPENTIANVPGQAAQQGLDQAVRTERGQTTQTGPDQTAVFLPEGTTEPANISSDVIRGYIDLMILRVLWDGDSYGYEISRRITELAEGSYAMKETTLYSAFTRLEKLAALRSYPGTFSGGRERTYYALTTTGRSLYRQKCAEWGRTKSLIAKFILKEEEI